MPKCADCKYEGKYSTLQVPYPIEMMMGTKFGMPGKVNVTLIGFEEEARKHGFTKDDLSKKGMYCQAPGGGPTSNPIVLIQALTDQPCSYFAQKDSDDHIKQTTMSSVVQKPKQLKSQKGEPELTGKSRPSNIMTTKTKSTLQEEQLPDPVPQEEDTVTFKRSHFYSVLVVLAFAVGILVGYIAWGFNVAAPASPLPPVVIAASPVPTMVPTPVIYDIPTKGYPSLGPADAPITIVEFSDYQCPYCARWHEQTYKALMDTYPGKIRFVYRNFPLPFHQNALLSAQAALCAGDQNSYWQYHDKLFAEKDLMNDQAGTVLGIDAYVKFASDLNLDTTTFEECLTKEKYKQFVEDDANSTASLPPENGEPAVGGTPTFFINGHRLVGAVPLSYFQQIIDPELGQ